MNYFKVLNKDLLYEIIQCLDYPSYWSLYNVIDRKIDLLDNIRWEWILSTKYPNLYKNLKAIGETTALNILILYYFYKDNLHGFKKLFDMKINQLTSLSEFNEYFDPILNNYPFLIKLLLYQSYPGTYHRFIGLIDELRYNPLQKMKLNNLKGLLHSLMHAGRAWVLDYLVYGKLYYTQNSVIQNYICNGKSNNILKYWINPDPSSFDDLIPIAGMSNMFVLDNYIFLWLYYTDNNVKFSGDILTNETILLFSRIARDLNVSISKIIYKLTEGEINYFSYNLGYCRSKSKYKAITEYYDKEVNVDEIGFRTKF